MLPLWKEVGIRKALKEGNTFENIAREFHVSVGVVHKISRLPAIRKRSKPAIPYKLRVKRRCPECGGLVYYWPCVLCRPWAYYYDDASIEEEFNVEKKAA